jgi:apolipoprotein D and lipocalin family protein
MRRLAMLLPLLLAACSGAPEGPPVRTVPAVELSRYLGDWYEVARFPNRFEDGAGLDCAEVTASYAPREAGGISVINRCRNAAAGGAARDAQGRAYVVEGSNGAKLRVSFFWPFYGDYWVIGLDPEYRWAVVGEPRREYLWLLSRAPNMTEADYAAAVATAQAQGFDVSKLRRTVQSAAR